MKHVMPLILAAVVACGPTPTEQAATQSVKEYLAREVGGLCSAARALQESAPNVAWTAPSHASAVLAMRTEWKRAHLAYAHVEGAVATLFPELDRAIDATYDEIATADADAFDGEGVVGLHAIERILWAEEIPLDVVEFEQGLAFYAAAAPPPADADAVRFAEGLVGRLITDCERLQSELGQKTLDAAGAFRIVLRATTEQHDKVLRASTAKDESRYAQHTLADLRANLEGAREVYGAFTAWLRSKYEGELVDVAINDGLEELRDLYMTTGDEALPPVPAGFDPNAPNPQMLESDFGRLFKKLAQESDAAAVGSLLTKMNEATDLLGLPR